MPTSPELLLGPHFAGHATPIWLVSESTLPPWLAQCPPAAAAWVRAQGFQAERQRLLPVPAADGRVGAVLLGLGTAKGLAEADVWSFAALSDKLPAGNYRLADQLPDALATAAALGWLLGAYRYSRYRSSAAPCGAALVAPAAADLRYALAAAEATALARDLINTPANDMGPEQLEAALRAVAARHGATVHAIVGDELLQANLGLIHAVGRASAQAPRMLELRWGEAQARRVALVGKGVCFDSGGLDLKPSASMLLMKKDMGGAACAMATAQMLMALGAKLQLHLLIPAVENSVSANAFRPGDVLRSRKGLSIEVGNTDAEGRLVLADALAEADAADPALLVDFATLTGAARTALGPELPPVYSNREALLDVAREAGRAEGDPLWPMPLWPGYDEDLASKIADVCNVAGHAFAGSIIGALFLQRFVRPSTPWLHLDIYGWNSKEKPGRPVGAEAQGVRAVCRMIRDRET